MAFDRLLLIIPPQLLLMEGFKTAMIALAAYLRRRLPDLEIKIIDLSATPRSAVHSILLANLKKQSGRTLAGISTVTADYQSALSVADELKNIDRDIITIFGGHHATGDTETILRTHRRTVNFIICGEGEIPLYQFIRCYPRTDNVPGLAFYNDDNVKMNPRPGFLSQKELDLVPLTFEGWDQTSSPGKFEHVTYVSARGCPLACEFCAVGKERIRFKSGAQVERDIRELVARGFSKIAFEDNFFGHNNDRTREVCEVLTSLQTESVHFSWDCQTRVEMIDRRDSIDLMQKAGCEAVYLGVESLNPKVLRFLGKAQNPDHYLSRLVDHVVPALLDSRINCYINLQFGLPGENTHTEELQANLLALTRLSQMAESSGKTITIFPQLFVVYPGTGHSKRYIDCRLFPKDVFERFTRWEAEQKPILNWLGETFAHGAGGIPLGILDQRSLWDGKYRVDPKAVDRVSSMIAKMDDLQGIHVFRYGSYLVKENSNVQSTSSRLPQPSRPLPRIVASNRNPSACAN